ncbi:MAG: hypothetical protein P1V35_11300 [Planctomycetota bacterium]|nr:hypothetical protein [Planctomycetota bacterium]
MFSIHSGLLALALAFPITQPASDEGQGTAEPGANLSGLNMGNHLLGPSFDSSDMRGKVLVVEIGGG